MGPRSPGDPGGVDLYVGGVEQAVLHLLYARFWQKVLHDLGHVSAEEPFRRLFNQGYVEANAYTDDRGVHVPAAEVEEPGRRLVLARRPGQPGVRQDGQEPEELGHPGRDLRRLRRRHPAGLRDGHRRRSTRPGPGTPAPSSGPTACCSGSGAPSSTRTPAPTGWWRGRHPRTTRRLLHRTDRGGPGRHRGAAVQHRHRPDHRAVQPPHRDLPRRCPAGGRRGAGPDAGAAGATHRRGAVAAHGPRLLAGLGGVPRGRPGRTCSATS